MIKRDKPIFLFEPARRTEYSRFFDRFSQLDGTLDILPEDRRNALNTIEKIMRRRDFRAFDMGSFRLDTHRFYAIVAPTSFERAFRLVESHIRNGQPFTNILREQNLWPLPPQKPIGLMNCELVLTSDERVLKGFSLLLGLGKPELRDWIPDDRHNHEPRYKRWGLEKLSYV